MATYSRSSEPVKDRAGIGPSSSNWKFCTCLSPSSSMNASPGSSSRQWLLSTTEEGAFADKEQVQSTHSPAPEKSMVLLSTNPDVHFQVPPTLTRLRMWLMVHNQISVSGAKGEHGAFFLTTKYMVDASQSNRGCPT